MLIGDPPPTQADLHFTLLGIPVRVHPFFWLIGLLLGPWRAGGVREMLIWLAAFFIGILVHEFGHAWIMRAYAFRPWITLYGLGGMASYDQAATHGARGAGSLPQILISAAGPGAGFLLAAAVVGLLLATGHQVGHEFALPFGLLAWPKGPVLNNPYLGLFVYDLLFVTIAYGVLNLMPIYPLDGGQISREVFLALNPRDGIRQSLILSMIVGVALAAMFLTAHAWYAALLFGYLAYISFSTLQAYSGRGRW